MSRIIKIAAVLLILFGIWSVAGESIRTAITKTFHRPASSAERTAERMSADPNRAYWEAFWALYPEGSGFGMKGAMEDLPVGGVTDPVLLDLHDVCLRYFDDMEENHWKRDSGKEYLTDDLVRGKWASDVMPLIRRAKGTYGVP